MLETESNDSRFSHADTGTVATSFEINQPPNHYDQIYIEFPAWNFLETIKLDCERIFYTVK